MKQFLKAIITEAGNIALEYVKKVHTLVVDEKQSKELVSEADYAIDQFLITEIKKRFPEHGIFTEESGEIPGAEFRWVIDPIDGTTTFLHEMPFFSISIALEKAGQTILAAVNAPVLDELFEAEKENGAYLNGRPIKVSRRSKLSESVLCTGFACLRAGLEHNNLAYVTRLLPELQDLHRHGSAAIDLGYVACGRLEGFWELHLNIYDVAAGFLILSEAGGRNTDFTGGTSGFYDEVLSTNGHIHDDMVRILSEVKIKAGAKSSQGRRF